MRPVSAAAAAAAADALELHCRWSSQAHRRRRRLYFIIIVIITVITPSNNNNNNNSRSSHSNVASRFCIDPTASTTLLHARGRAIHHLHPANICKSPAARVQHIKPTVAGDPQVTAFLQTGSHHNDTTSTPHFFKKCGVGVM